MHSSGLISQQTVLRTVSGTVNCACRTSASPVLVLPVLQMSFRRISLLLVAYPVPGQHDPGDGVRPQGVAEGADQHPAKKGGVSDGDKFSPEKKATKSL